MSIPGQRFEQLDGLRFFAVAAVMVEHFAPLGDHLRSLLNCGMFGVQLFFTISGFLITGILLDMRRDHYERGELLGSIGRFYARRALRIFPIYYLLCFVLLASGLKAMVETWPWQVFYLSDVGVVVNGGFPGAVGHFWSLSVEEQFYMFWPWLMLTLPLRGVPIACAAAIALGITSRLVMHIYQVPFGGMLMVCNLDTLAAGAWVAYAWRHQPDSGLLRWLGSRSGLVISALLVLAMKIAGPYVAVIDSTMMNVVMASLWASLVLQASHGFSGVVAWVLTWRPITYLGQISYGIYLFHNLMLPTLQLRVMPRLGLPEDGVIPVLAAVVLTVAVAALSFHLFERPISDLKRYFPYRPRPQPAGDPQPG